MKMLVAGMSLAAVLAAAPSQAQTLRPVLDLATADAIRNHCLAHAQKAGYEVAVAVFDHGGDLVSYAKQGTRPAPGAIAQWKGRSAAVYLRSTLETAGWNMANAPMMSTAEGGVPLFTPEGVGIGGVGVSGAPSAFDAECGTRAAEAAGLRTTRPEG